MSSDNMLPVFEWKLLQTFLTVGLTRTRTWIPVNVKCGKKKQVVKVFWQQATLPPHSGIREVAPVCIAPPPKKCFLGSTRVQIKNGISIGSAVFAQLGTECFYTLQWASPSPLKIARSHGGSGPHLIHGSLGYPSPQPKRHLDWFSHFCRAHVVLWCGLKSVKIVTSWLWTPWLIAQQSQLDATLTAKTVQNDAY